MSATNVPFPMSDARMFLPSGLLRSGACRQRAHLPIGRTPRVAGAMTVVLLAATACTPSGPPPFVDAVERVPYATTAPATDPADWLLAFVDVETTGLVPGWHEMIDLGVVMTDLDGVVVDSFFVRVQPEHPDRASPGAVAVNAFDADRWRALGASAPADAVEALAEFHARTAGGRNVMMVAFNSQFDAAFLDHLFRTSGRTWRELYHYFVLDIPSMAWSLGLRELTGGGLAERLGVPDEPRVAEDHTGITGAMLNARLYQALVRLRDGEG